MLLFKINMKFIIKKKRYFIAQVCIADNDKERKKKPPRTVEKTISPALLFI